MEARGTALYYLLLHLACEGTDSIRTSQVKEDVDGILNELNIHPDSLKIEDLRHVVAIYLKQVDVEIQRRANLELLANLELVEA